MKSDRESTDRSDERLSALIRLKRSEKPDPAFWQKFEEELRSKQLAALVRTQTWYERTGRLAILIARKTAPTAATASALALAFVAVNHTPFLATTTETESPATIEIAGSIRPEVSDTAASDEPLFVVEDVFHFAAPLSPTLETISASSENAVYGVNVLSRPSVIENYQIVASPKTLTTRKSATESADIEKFGAKVIRANQKF